MGNEPQREKFRDEFEEYKQYILCVYNHVSFDDILVNEYVQKGPQSRYNIA